MKWGEAKLVQGVLEKIPWAISHAQVPTLLWKDKCLRVYFATRPSHDSTLICYCDLDLSDFTKVLYVHPEPILDFGEKGSFDEFGLMPSSIVNLGDRIYLYYSGWSRSVGVPYSNFTGVAVSKDGGDTFKKIYRGPILDRTEYEIFSATSPEVFLENGEWNMWYCSGTHWHEVNGKLEHTYNIKFAKSKDGLKWDQENHTSIAQKNEFEAITKPSILKFSDVYSMWYCYRGTQNFRFGDDAYRIGYAESLNLKTWSRKDNFGGIATGLGDWDTQMRAYPAVIRIGDSIYMFYNGDGFGKSGFGFTKLIT